MKQLSLLYHVQDVKNERQRENLERSERKN